MVKPTKVKAKERIQKALDRIPALKERRFESAEFSKWRRDTEIAITNTFGEDTRHIEDFRRISYSPFPERAVLIPSYLSSTESGEERSREAFLNGLNRAESVLASIIDEVEEYWPDEEEAFTILEDSQVDAPIDTKKVFIVHGRDHGTRDMVARFIQQLEIEPIILQEQPNKGLTVIEKFEKHAQVGFAVVLFTPDDIGSAKDNADTPRYRARQNVIFELGYLIRHLGRNRVAVLYKGDEGDIEIPSDYAGVLYTQIDDGDGWKFELIREMKSAGLNVDANQAFAT